MTINQKEPSLWMCVAIAQSLLWLFGLPVFLQNYWDRVFGPLSSERAEFVINLTPLVFYICYSAVMLPIYYIQHPFFEQYKIQSDRSWPWIDERKEIRRAFWALSRRSVKITAFNLLILAPLLSMIKIYIVSELGFDGPSFATDKDSWPTPLESLHDVILLSLVHEFGFYTTHRLMHTYPSLYKYHKIHHEYKCNTTLASLHNHAFDFIFSIGFPAVLAISVVGSHSVTQFQWIIWTIYANMDDHVGYSFPWSPVRWFPFAALTDEHEFHHLKNLGCFGSKFNIFNTLLGGREYYDRWVDKRKEKMM